MALKPVIHGRDHCPDGADPIPCLTMQVCRGVRYLSNVTVAGASQVVVDWDKWQNSSSDVFTPLDTGLNPADPDEVIRRVQLNKDGYYTFTFAAHPTTAIAGTVEMAMHDGDPIWSREESVLHGNNTSLAVGFYVASFSRIYPMQDPLNSGAHTKQISFTLAQNGGSSEDFSELWFEIHYWGGVNFP